MADQGRMGIIDQRIDIRNHHTAAGGNGTDGAGAYEFELVCSRYQSGADFVDRIQPVPVEAATFRFASA